MQAGRLRDRVTVQRATTTADDYGQEVAAWQDAGEHWCEVRPTFNRGDVSHTVRLRAEAGPLAPLGHRLLWQGRILDVLEVDGPDGRNIELRAECREQLAPDGG